MSEQVGMRGNSLVRAVGDRCLGAAVGCGRLMNALLDAIHTMRGPVVVVAVTVVLLTVPAQTREIYRILALNLGEALTRTSSADGRLNAWAWLQVVLAVLSVFVAGFVVWYVGRSVTRRSGRRKRESGDAEAAPAEAAGWWEDLFLAWGPRLLGAAVLAGFARGLWLAKADLEELKFRSPGAALDNARALLQLTSALCAALALLLLIFTFLRTRNLPLADRQRDRLFRWPVRIGCYALWTVCVLLVVAFPVAVPQLVGAVPVSMLLVIIAVFVVTMLLGLPERSANRLPVFSLLAIWVLVASGFDWNDNHPVRTIPLVKGSDAMRMTEAVPAQSTAAMQFAEWLAKRADKADYTGDRKRYPVVIVTASGGGLYAAHFAAVTLARLQDDCPAFAQHVFAVSGVSGGSVGAAMFAALAGKMAANDTSRKCLEIPATRGQQPQRRPSGSFETAVAQLLDRDLMSPIVAAAFFPDLAQTVVPFSWLGLDRWLNLDRARAFELSLEKAWNELGRSGGNPRLADGNPLAAPFLDHWQASKATPALLLNTTEVSQGHRVVISPFRITDSDKVMWNKLLWYRAPGYIESGVDVSLATAAGLSARFPWILPAASHHIRVASEKQTDCQPGSLGPGSTTCVETRKIRVIDGGVFENSGVETALDLLAELRHFETARSFEIDGVRHELPAVQFHLLSIGDFEDHFPMYVRGFSELMSPVRALLSARSSRASFALSRADDQLCTSVGAGDGGSGTCVRAGEVERTRPAYPLQPIYLNHYDHVLTLGWQLSKLTLRVLYDHVGVAGACKVGMAMPQRRAPAGVPVSEPVPKGLTPEERQERIKNNNDCTACAVRHILQGHTSFQGREPC